jgi:acetoin utilization deacetylase AcuC-like enzyme
MADAQARRRVVGFISDPGMVAHDTGPRHPERPDRLRAVHRALREAGLLTSPDPFPTFSEDLRKVAWTSMPAVELPLREATDDDLLLCHTRDHLNHIEHVCHDGGGVLDAGDTPVVADSDQLARRSAGAGLAAVDAVLDGTKGVQRCFVACRPPGHHAEPEKAMGFCLYSNAALAARHAVRGRGLARVAVVDFDVHHGNGTQACLHDDPSVLFVSIHQHPQTCYPGTGFEWEIGVGAGRGFTLNVPLPPTAGDRTYHKAMEEKVLPKLDAFKPELLICSAGFDAHADDPLADMELTDDGFAEIGRMLMDVADRHCAGRAVSVMEGGYNLGALARGVARHMIVMQG